MRKRVSSTVKFLTVALMMFFLAFNACFNDDKDGGTSKTDGVEIEHEISDPGGDCNPVGDDCGAADQAAVEADRDDLEIGFAHGNSYENVTEDLIFAVEGLHGSEITWISENEDLVSESGAVFRPCGYDETITLTAVISKGAAEEEKSFTVAVKALELSELVYYGFEDETLAPCRAAYEISASPLSLFKGDISHTQGNPGYAVSGRNWGDADENYFEFTISVSSGAIMPVFFEFDNRASGTGPVSWGIRSDADNYGDILSSGDTSDSFSETPMVNADVSGIPAGTGVTVRIYGYGASSGSGTWRVDNIRVMGCHVE